MGEQERHIHLISDSTGETLLTTVRAVLAPFNHIHFRIHESFMLRSAQDLETALATIETYPGLVFHTLVDQEHRSTIEAAAAAKGPPAIALLDPLIAQVADYLETEPSHRPGMQHRIDDDYLGRIAALDFAIAHDDGALGTRMLSADVILTGVSRTSKTPTCIYLAHRGVKAANMPLIPGAELDPAFFQALEADVLAVGLTISPARLEQIRTNRLEALGDRHHSYADLDRIRDEVSDARLFFDRHGLPVIDVTRRSIEETAAEIIALLRTHRMGSS